MFGTKAKIVLKSTLLSTNIISNLRTEEDLKEAQNSISTIHLTVMTTSKTKKVYKVTYIYL